MVPTRQTAPELAVVLEELRRREPIFHRPEFGTSRADFESIMEPDFWETGASGRRYSREFVLQELERRHRPGHELPDEWQTSDFRCQQLADDLFLLTYTLRQHSRVTRRATLWRRRGNNWTVAYHQGTEVTRPDSP